MNIESRVLALAGMLQALQQVRRIADTGHADAEALRTAIESVRRIDAATPSDVYGGSEHLRAGLKLLRQQLTNQLEDPLLPRLALAVLQLERSFLRNAHALEGVQSGIARLDDDGDPTDSGTLSALGKLYAEFVSPLKPKVMVQGNPHYLSQPHVVAEVRAVLLAALRSAVLWRQMGGSMWDFLLRKRTMDGAAEALLQAS